MGSALAEHSGDLPHSGPWTVEAVEALPETGHRYEILAPGVLTVSPAPGGWHQRASFRLAVRLAEILPPGLEVLENVNVVIPDGRLCQPDVVIVDTAFVDTNPTRFPPSRIRVVVEIVSPGSQTHDRLIKPRLYAAAGIPVYWRLELEKTPRLIVSELRRGRYTHLVTAVGGTSTVIEQPFRIELDPADLVRRPER